jgi:predicted nucleotide-binding protein
MLRRWDLDPLILDQLTSGGQTIIEKLESVRKDTSFAVVLATPDDEGIVRRSCWNSG